MIVGGLLIVFSMWWFYFDMPAGQIVGSVREAFAVTVPVAAYLLTVWALHVHYKRPSLLRNYAVPVTVSLILISSLTPQPVLITGGLLAGLVIANIAVERLTVPAR